MGVASSSEHERHVRNLSDLRFFDVVLMTSEVGILCGQQCCLGEIFDYFCKATIRGLGVEDRIAQQIKCCGLSFSVVFWQRLSDASRAVVVQAKRCRRPYSLGRRDA